MTNSNTPMIEMEVLPDSKWRTALRDRPLLVLGIVLIALVIATAIIEPRYLSVSGLRNTVLIAAGVWTKDVTAAHKIAAKLKAGTVWVNCHAMIDPALPFGGYKESGIGHEQGRLGLEAYLETKSVLMKL